jgi:hypothetical protein
MRQARDTLLTVAAGVKAVIMEGEEGTGHPPGP